MLTVERYLRLMLTGVNRKQIGKYKKQREDAHEALRIANLLATYCLLTTYSLLTTYWFASAPPS